MKIYTLTISHRHGRDVSAHASYAEAHAALAAYVRQWWEREGLAGQPPADDAEAIAYYFERVDDESADIDECELPIPDMRAPVLLDRTGAADGDVIGLDADGCVINEPERGEPYNSGESLHQFGNISSDPGDCLGNLTEKEAKALLAALYSRIWPGASHA